MTRAQRRALRDRENIGIMRAAGICPEPLATEIRKLLIPLTPDERPKTRRLDAAPKRVHK